MLQLSVTVADPYLKAWIALMTAICAGAGVGCFLFFVVLHTGWPPPGGNFVVNSAIILLILTVPAAAIVLIFRRRFQRLSHNKQWLLSSIGIGLVFFSFAAFFAQLH
jgi:hypothetical protein